MPTSSCHSENGDDYINIVDNSDDIAQACDGAGLKVAYTNTDQLTTVKQDISADMLFSRFSRLTANPRK